MSSEISFILSKKGCPCKSFIDNSFILKSLFIGKLLFLPVYSINTFDKLLKEKTTLFITHRLSTIKEFDNIVVMDDGCIVEQGSHNDLLNKSKIYENMWLNEEL